MNEPGDDVVTRAVLCADAQLAKTDPAATRMEIATDVTLAVLPILLDGFEQLVREALTETAEARAQTRLAQAELINVASRGADHSRRLRVFFEEIDPDAVAAQIIGHLESSGRSFNEVEIATMAWTVSQTLQRIAQSISLALETDSTEFARGPE